MARPDASTSPNGNIVCHRSDQYGRVEAAARDFGQAENQIQLTLSGIDQGAKQLGRVTTASRVKANLEASQSCNGQNCQSNVHCWPYVLQFVGV